MVSDLEELKYWSHGPWYSSGVNCCHGRRNDPICGRIPNGKKDVKALLPCDESRNNNLQLQWWTLFIIQEGKFEERDQDNSIISYTKLKAHTLASIMPQFPCSIASEPNQLVTTVCNEGVESTAVGATQTISQWLCMQAPCKSCLMGKPPWDGRDAYRLQQFICHA